MWQKAKFIEGDTRPFWVKAEPPEEHEFPPLNAEHDGFDYDEKCKSLWYRTNVLEPRGHFMMWAPRDGVELLSEFAEMAQPDDRYLLPKEHERKP